MNILLNETLKDLRGNPFKYHEDELTMKSFIVEALLHESNEEISGEEKLKRFNLAKTVYESERIVDLKSEDIVLIKSQASKLWVTAVYGAGVEYLET